MRLNNGNGTFTPARASRSEPCREASRLGDLDGDGDLDFVVRQLPVEQSLGDAQQRLRRLHAAAGSPVPVGTRPVAVMLADFDGDDDLDIAVTNNTTNNVSILLNNGSGGFTARVARGTGAGPRGIAAGDLDGDGDIDLVVANFGADTVSILLNNGSGGFTRPARRWRPQTTPTP